MELCRSRRCKCEKRAQCKVAIPSVDPLHKEILVDAPRTGFSNAPV